MRTVTIGREITVRNSEAGPIPLTKGKRIKQAIATCLQIGSSISMEAIGIYAVNSANAQNQKGLGGAIAILSGTSFICSLAAFPSYAPQMVEASTLTGYKWQWLPVSSLYRIIGNLTFLSPPFILGLLESGNKITVSQLGAAVEYSAVASAGVLVAGCMMGGTIRGYRMILISKEKMFELLRIMAGVSLASCAAYGIVNIGFYAARQEANDNENRRSIGIATTVLTTASVSGCLVATTQDNRRCLTIAAFIYALPLFCLGMIGIADKDQVVHSRQIGIGIVSEICIISALAFLVSVVAIIAEKFFQANDRLPRQGRGYVIIS